MSGDVSITTSSGSRLYDFSGTTGNINVYFGEDAAIEMHGGETGSKCLAYNIDPNQNLKTKYSLTGLSSKTILPLHKFTIISSVTFSRISM